MNLRLLIIIPTILFVNAVFAQTVTKKVSGVFQHPESVTSDLKYYYVSNLGKELKPMATDSDGFITRLSKTGAVLDTNFLPHIKLNSPKGLTVLQENLWIADVNRVLVVSLKTKKVIWSKEFPETKFLNDIVVKDETTIYVSATDINVIYEIDLLQDTTRAYDTQGLIDGPNGMAIDNLSDNLYVAGYGSGNKQGYVCRFNLRTGEVQRVSSSGFFDGIYFTFGKYYFTDWGTEAKPVGKLWQYDVRFNKASQLYPDINFQGPADFYFVPGSKTIILPAMQEHAVYFLKLNGKEKNKK